MLLHVFTLHEDDFHNILILLTRAAAAVTSDSTQTTLFRRFPSMCRQNHNQNERLVEYA